MTRTTSEMTARTIRERFNAETWGNSPPEQHGSFIASLPEGNEERGRRLRNVQTQIELVMRQKDEPTWNDGHSQYSDIPNPIEMIQNLIKGGGAGGLVDMIKEKLGMGPKKSPKVAPEEGGGGGDGEGGEGKKKKKKKKDAA